MTYDDLSVRLADLIQLDDPARLKAALAEQHPADLAAEFADLPPPMVARLIPHLPEPRQPEVFGYLPPLLQAALAAILERRLLIRIISAMPHDERADLFLILPEDRRDVLLALLAHQEREDVRALSAYPAGSAGAVMTSDYATLTPDLTAAEAIAALRLVAPDRETIYNAYVIDADRRLVGVVSLRDLILAEPEARLSDFMVREVIFVRAGDPQHEAARKIAKYDLLALPVVNGDDMLAGIVTADDAFDVAEAQATEAFHRAGTVQDLDAPVRKASIFKLYRSRIVWLVLLVFGNIFSGLGIAAYEETIAAYVALVFFLPLLIASGGNAGAQSATLMVRALATGDVRAGDWVSLLGREFLVAVLLGVSMAFAVSLIGLVRGGPDIALVVASSMVLIVLVGSLVGMLLPFLLSRFRLDPAIASAPLVTSIADASGVLIYFALATTLLPRLA